MISVRDMTVQLCVSPAATGGKWSLSEWSVPPYSVGLPLHWHARTQKVCCVMQGILAWTRDQHMFTLTASDCIVIPAGTRHEFFNPAAAPATLLM